MSVVDIPWSRIKRVGIRPQLFSGEQEGSLGGPTLPVPRPGDRFAVDVQTTQFRQDAESRLFMAAMFEATTGGARILLRQPNRGQPAAFGQPVVDGAGQAGSSIALRGLQPSSTLRRGEFFHVLHGGVGFLYMVAAQSLAGANGKVVVPIWPMLRFLTVDGEQVEIGAPAIEGKLVGFDKGASFSANRGEPIEFSIMERA